MPTYPSINSDRLWADLQELGSIGQRGLDGLFRIALSSADMEAKAWLKHRMTGAGLEVSEDQACNQIGRLAGQSHDIALALGSHLDTVPGGGRFDGALGVLAALECVRTIAEHKLTLNHALEVINFCDEEGSHGRGTLGSRAMLGMLSPDEINQEDLARDFTLRGKNPFEVQQAGRDPKQFAAYFELHIEQGRVLEELGVEIGAVTAIVGIKRYWITVRGRSGHAGTTPMHLRRDALVEASPLFNLLPQWVREQNPEMVGTIGQLELEPGAANVIPSRCSFMVELRSPLARDLEIISGRILEYAAARPDWELSPVYNTAPVSLSPPLIELVESSARSAGLSCHRMPSGAGHDAHSFAASGVPSAMIFIPCRQGLSHCPDEDITPRQAAQGCQILLNSILALDQQGE